MTDPASIESVLREDRRFEPPSDIDARVGGLHVARLDDYRAMHRRSLEDPEGFWAEVAGTLDWFTPWERVLEWNAPDAKWFVGGTTNVCHNCVDRHVAAGHGDEVAIIWEGEPMPGGTPEIRRLTYRDLQVETSRLANALQGLGVGKGDVVHHLHGHGPGAGGRHPCVRAHRGGALGDLRWLQRPGDHGSGRRREEPGDPHGRWCMAARQRRALEGQRGRGVRAARRRGARGRACRRAQALRERHRVGRGPRPRLGWPRRRCLRGVPVRADGQRGHAVPAVHLRLDRQAEGHRPHNGRVPRVCLPHESPDVQPAAGRRPGLLVHGGYRLDHRAQRTSSTACCRTACRRSCTRARRTTRARPVLGHLSLATG